MSLTYHETKYPIANNTDYNDIVFYNSNDEKARKTMKGRFEIIPDVNKEFEFIYVFGASGCGKSFFTSQYALMYRRIFPKNNIYLFSQKYNDPAFSNKHLKIRHVPVNEDFLETEFDVLNIFNDCLIIFDDFLSFPNKKIVEKICNIIIQILTLGRTNRIFCVITAHLLYQNNNKSLYMNIQNEIHKIVFFKGVNMFQLNYCLINYWGFDKKTIKKILEIDPKSRWKCLNKYPLICFTQNTLNIL